MKSVSAFLLFSCLCIGIAASGFAAETPSVEEIVSRLEHTAYYLGKDGRAKAVMLIKDSQGRERKRRFTILRRDERSDELEKSQAPGIQKYFVHISYPSDLRNTVLMVWKQPDGQDDRWLYLPALDLTKRIAASDKRTSFLGSDFFYEDISGRSTDEDTHELSETTDTYYVLKNVPKQPDSVEFSYYTIWAHRQTYLPIKVEFYDKQGTKYRVYEALKVERIQQYPTITQSRMNDLVTGQQTLLTLRNIQYDTGITEDVFSERYLRNPPRSHLR